MAPERLDGSEAYSGTSPLYIDCLQYSRWSETIFRQMRAGGVAAVHVTVCYHEGLDCMDETPVCMERTSDDENGLGTCSSYTDEDTGEVVNYSPFPSAEGFLRIRCATEKEPAGPLPPLSFHDIWFCSVCTISRSKPSDGRK